jgi:hypothetical protein
MGKSQHQPICFEIVADHARSFCTDHASYDQNTQAHWLMIRDIIHALLVPVVELFDKAVRVATQATKATRPEDLEFAYVADARAAFIWLQCFLASEQEQDWCSTRGCPACVANHSFDSEFNVRLLYAACLLSDAHHSDDNEAPSLPNLIFFSNRLRHALAIDELFGNDFFDRLHDKANATLDGVEDLIQQVYRIDGLLSQPTSPAINGAAGSEACHILMPLGRQPMTKLKRSKMAKRQMKLKAEADYWIEEVLTQCWDALHPVTDQPVLNASAYGLNDSVKTCALVSVSELAPE